MKRASPALLALFVNTSDASVSMSWTWAPSIGLQSHFGAWLAGKAVSDPDQADDADFPFRQIAELREAGR
jgi:hypothetical protein